MIVVRNQSELLDGFDSGGVLLRWPRRSRQAQFGMDTTDVNDQYNPSAMSAITS